MSRGPAPIRRAPSTPRGAIDQVDVDRSAESLALPRTCGLAVPRTCGLALPRTCGLALPGPVDRAPARSTRAMKGQTEERDMRFMVIVKASKESEAGVMPDRKLLTEMGKYNEQLSKAGVFLAGEGLHPTSKGKRVKFSGTQRTVIDGPFAETKELIAGYWLWQAKSMDEAVEWLKRAPFDGGTEVEVRQVVEAADFGDEFTPELRRQEEAIRAQAAAKK